MKCRVLAFQPLSVNVKCHQPISLSIQGINCLFALRPAHIDTAEQLTHGGTFVAVEFSIEENIDSLATTRLGLDLIEDFFSAVALIEGAPFGKTAPIQIVGVDRPNPGEHTLLFFLHLEMNHWIKPLSQDTVESARSIVMHWDGLENGRRLRRAGHQFHRAVQSDNMVESFEQAHVGLEALEKPLAIAMEMTPGAEDIQGKCEACGATYTRRRTVLAGVRAYVQGKFHPETATAERNNEWRRINNLRHELFHSLGGADLEQEARGVLPATMHYLHDGICCLSHSHDLESQTFYLFRPSVRQIVFGGQVRTDDLGPLETWSPFFDVKNGYWVEHAEHGFVPEFSAVKMGAEDISGHFFWMGESLEFASEKDLIPADFEEK